MMRFTLIDHVVGAGQEQGGNVDPNRLGGLQVDRQPRPVDGLDGEIAGRVPARTRAT